MRTDGRRPCVLEAERRRRAAQVDPFGHRGAAAALEGGAVVDVQRAAARRPGRVRLVDGPDLVSLAAAARAGGPTEREDEHREQRGAGPHDVVPVSMGTSTRLPHSVQEPS